jgi:hypothetical protein
MKQKPTTAMTVATRHTIPTASPTFPPVLIPPDPELSLATLEALGVLEAFATASREGVAERRAEEELEMALLAAAKRIEVGTMDDDGTMEAGRTAEVSRVVCCGWVTGSVVEGTGFTTWEEVSTTRGADLISAEAVVAGGAGAGAGAWVGASMMGPSVVYHPTSPSNVFGAVT